MRTLLILFIFATLHTQYNYKNSPIYEEKKAQIITLGTFHFSYPSRDKHKTNKDKRVDILSKQRQEELKDVLNKLKEFKPTKIFVEWKPSLQSYVDSTYNEYINDNFELKRNEVYQIGYTLGKELGLKKIHCIDAAGLRKKRSEKEWKDLETSYEKWYEKNKSKYTKYNWHERYKTFYSSMDSYKKEHSLIETYRTLNDQKRIRDSHAAYFIDNMDFEYSEFDYAGINEGFISHWYNRNLQILRNIRRYTENENDRILVIIGSGHLPILNHLLENSPYHKLISPLNYLD